MSRPSDRPLWFGSGGVLPTLGGICFAGMLDSSPYKWDGGLMIAAYSLGAVAAVLAGCGLANLRFPLQRRAPEPGYPILSDPPPDDPRSGIRQAVEAARPEMGEALTASDVRRQLYRYCAKCGYPLDPPRLTPDCNGGGACDKRLHTPLAHRLRAGATSPLRVHPDWITEHPEAG